MLRTRTTTSIIVALALATPSAAAAQQDLRSPDARDAGGGVGLTQDLRSPDARDASGAAAVERPASQVSSDLRSPDARDAATRSAPAVAPSTGTPVVDGSDGFRWEDAGIGALAMLGIVLGGVGLAALVMHTRRREDMPPTTP